MKTHTSKQKNQALTLFEVLFIVALLMILAAMLLPMLAASNRRSSRINCVNNLKQVGLAARIWEGDNNNKYPMAVSVTNGGALELISTGNVSGYFQVMSNELSTTKILICPMDTNHVFASNFVALKNSNISYFVSVEATESYPQMLLFGDDNLTTDGGRHAVKSGIFEITTNTEIAWTATRHINIGNLSFADGSVAEESTIGLTNAVQYNFGGTPMTTNHWAIP